MNQNPSAERGTAAATDSPWFWLAVFLCSALAVLAIVAPKYVTRQPQIERQYQARELSGQAVMAGEAPQSLSQPDRLMISLRPLQLTLAVLLLFATAGFWYDRWRRAREGRGS